MLKRSAHVLTAIGTALAASVLALSSAPAHAATATSEVPRVGECHAMTPERADSYSDARKPVPCSKRHTSVTFGVVHAQSPLAGLSQELLTTMGADACTKLEIQKLGRSVVRRATTAYGLVFFQPTVAQMQAGEQWFRCDLVQYAAGKLLPMPAHLHHPILTARPTASTERCLTSDYYATPCSMKHSYRPSDVLRFKPVAYPTRAQFRYTGKHACSDENGHFTWPSKSRWEAGDRYLVCYTKTSR